MLSKLEAIEEDMKKQYVKPDAKVVEIRLLGSVLQDQLRLGPMSFGADSADSRYAHNFYEDDEEESIEVNIWK